MVCVVLCVLMLNDMLMNVCFPLYIFFYMLCIWFHVWYWSLRGRRNEFQFFLYLSQRVPARSAVEESTRSALTKGLGSLSFVLIHPQVQLGTGAMQGVHRPSEFEGFEPKQELKDRFYRCAQSQSIQALESVWWLLQGVRTGSLF
jgi:hypothetical protein